MNDDSRMPANELPIIRELDAISNDIIEAMPEVQAAAIEAHEKEKVIPVVEPAKVSAVPGVATDRDGVSFDAKVHVVDAAGNPSLTASGKLKKRPGQKKGATPAQPKQPSTIGGVASTSTLSPAQKQQAAVTGNVSASLLITCSMMIGGQEFAPVIDAKTGIDEKAALSTAFTDYYIATNRTDLPPNVALILTIGMYVLPRFTHQTVRERVKSKTTGIRDWFKSLKKTKKAEKPKEAKDKNAQSDTRDDGKRKNDTGEVVSAKLQT